MFANFVLASFMVGLTVCIHFGGLLALMWLLRTRGLVAIHVVLDRHWRLVGAIEGANGTPLVGQRKTAGQVARRFDRFGQLSEC